MENNNKLEEYFVNIKDYDLISNKNNNSDNKTFNTTNIPDYDLISNKKISNNDTLRKPATIPNYNLISNGTTNRNIPINIQSKKENIIYSKNNNKLNYTNLNNIKNNNQLTKNKHYNNQNLQKSLSKTQIRKKDKKGRKVKILKYVLIGAITIIITANVGTKINNHIKTENIKKECIITMYDKIENQGYNTENLNLKEIILSSDQEFIKNNLFEFYLIIEKNYPWKEANKLYDLLVQKAGLANSFDKYLINEGYHDRQYYSSNGEDYYLTASKTKWENAMEAVKLAEKRIQETKSKGAK